MFIDVEGAGGNGRADNLDAATRTAVVNAFCQTIQNACKKVQSNLNPCFFCLCQVPIKKRILNEPSRRRTSVSASNDCKINPFSLHNFPVNVIDDIEYFVHSEAEVDILKEDTKEKKIDSEDEDDTQYKALTLDTLVLSLLKASQPY